MPCKKCRLPGHNSRTCTVNGNVVNGNVVDGNVVDGNVVDGKPGPVAKKYYCYILQQPGKIFSLNYVGYTVNVSRRLRQHNGIIKGGAFYTKNRGPWEFLAVMTCDTWNNIRAMQVEWLTKHPTRARIRPKCFTGSAGRINSLVEIVRRIPVQEEVRMYIHPSFHTHATTLQLGDNISLYTELNQI